MIKAVAMKCDKLELERGLKLVTEILGWTSGIAQLYV